MIIGCDFFFFEKNRYRYWNISGVVKKWAWGVRGEEGGVVVNRNRWYGLGLLSQSALKDFKAAMCLRVHIDKH